MAIIRVTKLFTFEMAHTLEGYDGTCSQIHGHSYKLAVTVRGVPSAGSGDPKLGMVLDFGLLKGIVGRLIIDRYDHALLMRPTPENRRAAEAMREHYAGVVEVDFQPTCENLATHFAEAIRAELPAGLELWSLRLHETATSFAEWFAEDNPPAR